MGAYHTGARADAQSKQRRSFGEAVAESEGSEGSILSEGGRETELWLTATPQRDHLLRLLKEHGAAGIKLNSDPRLIMSGGGGTGFSLWDIKKLTARLPWRKSGAGDYAVELTKGSAPPIIPSHS